MDCYPQLVLLSLESLPEIGPCMQLRSNIHASSSNTDLMHRQGLAGQGRFNGCGKMSACMHVCVPLFSFFFLHRLKVDASQKMSYWIDKPNLPGLFFSFLSNDFFSCYTRINCIIKKMSASFLSSRYPTGFSEYKRASNLLDTMGNINRIGL